MKNVLSECLHWCLKAILYRVIRNADDCKKRQRDISSLCGWESTWQMYFNKSKCFILHMSHKKNLWQAKCNMIDVPLESTSAQRYLGVEITSSLDWSVHINTIATNANKTVGILRGHLKHCTLKVNCV